MAPGLDPAIAAHYRHDPERDRLETWARLEGVRTRELLSRFLPPPPAVVLDVGGARGAYALPLAQAVPRAGTWSSRTSACHSAFYSITDEEWPEVRANLGTATNRRTDLSVLASPVHR